MSETLDQIIARLAVNEDEEATAQAVMRYLKVPTASALVLAPAVRLYIATQWRATARRTEHESTRRRPPGGPSFRPIADGPVERPRLDLTERFLNTTFAVARGGRRVTWGTATREDHRERIESMNKQIVGCESTRARHEAALAMLEATGAATLGDIAEPGQAAA